MVRTESMGVERLNSGGAAASLSDLPRRRRVFAVRDFPPGCGRLAAPILSRENEGSVCVVGTEKNLEDGQRIASMNDNYCLRCPDTVAGMELVGEFKSSSCVLMNDQEKSVAEEPAASHETKNGIELVYVEPAVIRRPEDSVDPFQEDAGNSKALQCTQNVLRDFKTVDDSSLFVVQKKKFPARRSIFAVRDFPPGCGKNAPQLGKEGADMVSRPENQKFGQETCDIGEERLQVIEKTGAKERGRDVDGGDAQKQNVMVKFKLLPPVPLGIIVQGLMAAPNCPWRQKKVHQFGRTSEIVTKPCCESRGLENLGKESIVCIDNYSPDKNLCVPLCSEDQMSIEEKLLEFDGTSEMLTKSGGDSRLEDAWKESGINMEGDRNSDKHLSVACKKDQKAVEIFSSRELPSNGSIVQGLMASQTCPWRQRKVLNNRDSFSGGISEAKGKKNDFILLRRSKINYGKHKKNIENLEESKTKTLLARATKASQDLDNLVVSDKYCDFELDKECDDFQLVQRSHNFGVSVPPISSRGGDKADEDDANVTRNQVRETLRLFQAVVRKLVQQKEAKAKEGGSITRRIDYEAAKILKDKGRYVNVGKPIIGIVPGVEVGDEFHYWVELTVIGLHRLTQAGIDYVKVGKNILAASIVASGGYDDDTDNSDVLIYTGQGGNNTSAYKEPMDQKLERGNLALKNSIDEQNPVRVIRGETKDSSSPDSRGRTYVYDGLYLVEKYWKEMGPYGTLVFKFKLVRIPGQPELAWKAVKRSKKLNVREGLCVDDISQGKEKIPISAVNTVDDQKPPTFEYVTHIIYPNWLHLIPPIGCGCSNRCSESGKCSCVAENGGEFPYNHDGAIVESKSLVYECGPRCKCPPSCYNRVSQHGIRFQLEIFKTQTRGWGVRSLNSIPSGSFICEYAGELIEDTEAEQRADNDEYLFDIGNDSSSESSLWDGLSTHVPEVISSSKESIEAGFTIDAARYGNVGRFVNHSCSPNLYAQNVLYDHGDRRIPHIMLFAAENIPPLQELTYHYNYMVDQVFDSNGNIKRKYCYCGSSECTGRMY